MLDIIDGKYKLWNTPEGVEYIRVFCISSEIWVLHNIFISLLNKKVKSRCIVLNNK